MFQYAFDYWNGLGMFCNKSIAGCEIWILKIICKSIRFKFIWPHIYDFIHNPCVSIEIFTLSINRINTGIYGRRLIC